MNRSVLLVSTYDLGRQPLDLAVAAAALRAAGHDVRCLDLAVEEWDSSDVMWADCLAFSVPMHTATRLAFEWARRARTEAPATPMCAFGLYASAAAETGGLDAAFGGEYLAGLLAWVEAPGPTRTARVDTRPAPPIVPDRSSLPDLGRYGRLVIGDDVKIVGAVATSRGCPSRCRHCPVPVVYDGRVRVTPEDAVAADADVLVEAGATHITFADADFLGAPHHAMRCVEAIHARHPGVTFDLTARVDRLLRHADVWPRLAAWGCTHVVSAFESTDPAVLRALDKGHTPGDMHHAVILLREYGLEIRPSWLPFTPLTTRHSLVDLLDFVEAHDLVHNVDPVQYSVRLLVPPGSLVLETEAFASRLDAYDPAALTWPWSAADPALDILQRDIAAVAEAGAARAEPIPETFGAVRSLVDAAAGIPSPHRVEVLSRGRGVRPQPTEAWFCCAEPTTAQLGGLGPAEHDAAVPREVDHDNPPGDGVVLSRPHVDE
ncbi:MAG: radical SAM protein [Acidimicrobiia bacterium]|nr:radical SAM protein [Acidimicrobiia bacterium]